VGTLIDYLSAHPVALIITGAVVLLLIYSSFKLLMKMLLITSLVFISLCGYNYYKAPDEFPGNVREMAAMVGDYSDDMIEAGKDVVEKGKSMIDKGRVLVDKVGESVKKKKKALTD